MKGREGECLLHNPNYAQSFLHHKIPEEGNTTSLIGPQLRNY
jgi:hypothetical protein